MSKIVGVLERRTPELLLSDEDRVLSESGGLPVPFMDDLKAVAEYACYRALVRNQNPFIGRIVQYFTDFHLRFEEEEFALSLAAVSRPPLL